MLEANHWQLVASFSSRNKIKELYFTIKNTKAFPCIPVLLLLLVIVALIPKHPGEPLYFPLAPKLRLLRSGKHDLKSLQTKPLKTFLIHTVLPQRTSSHHFTTLPGLYCFIWVKSGYSLVKPSLQKSSLLADPTCITSCYVQLHLPSAELYGMDSFPFSLMRKGDKQERVLAQKPQPWRLLTSSFLLALHSAAVLVYLVLFCDHSFRTEDHKKTMI